MILAFIEHKRFSNFHKSLSVRMEAVRVYREAEPGFFIAVKSW